MNRALQVLLRGGVRQIQPSTRNISTSAPKNGSGKWIYRESGMKYIPKKHLYACEAIGAFMWWWMLIHIYHEPDHILGEFPYPDPSKWTDAELGIPAE